MTELDSIAADSVAEASSRAHAGAAALMRQKALARVIHLMLVEYAAIDAVATLAACDAVMMGLRDRLPEPVFAGGSPFFSGQREECEIWADFASDGQIAAMLAACLDRIAGGQFQLADRKRLMVAIWNSLPPEDRKAFRDRVMPKENAR